VLHAIVLVRDFLSRAFWLASLAAGSMAVASAGQAQPTLVFGGETYVHRWSQAGQHEFTPAGQEDLGAWTDMFTVNVHSATRDGDALASVANGVLSNYEGAGRILRTNSVPRTAAAPAEHFIAAVLGNASFLEAAFARIVLVDGTGVVLVYSRRVYGRAAGDAMSAWLEANGERMESQLMSWTGAPAVVRALRGN
jgi:hypothetical protein